jgi:hypothetical protein
VGDIPGLQSTDALLAAISLLLTAVGLSTASGLRAYIPLLAVALGSHIPTTHGGHLVYLTQPFQFLGSLWFIALLVFFTLVEFVVDKIPVLVHVSDLIHTIVRPAAGAIIMAGTSNALSDRSLWLAAAIGAILALTVHSTKAASRAGIAGATAGLGNPVVSLGEDLLALALTVLSVIAPFLALVFLVLVAIIAAPLVVRGIRWYRRRQRKA